MGSTKWFGGKVEVRPLQRVEKPADRTEVLARIITPGGELAVLADGVTAIRHLGYVELKPGKVRGNHYHKLRHEKFYLISGESWLFMQDIQTGELAKCLLIAGDFALIAPNIAHAFLPNSAGHALEFAAEPFDHADVFRVEPLENPTI